MSLRSLVRILAVFAILPAASSWGESVTVVNRTGRVLDLIQAAPAGQDHWGDDLIPDRVVLDGENVVLDLIGAAPWAFRFLDPAGEAYVLYGVEPAKTGKVTVGPEHLARLAMFAGAARGISITNRTGSVLTSLRVSSVSDGEWGDDILSGRYLRTGETAYIEIAALPGELSFDIRFTLLSDNRDVAYVKSSVILTDGASLILTKQQAD